MNTLVHELTKCTHNALNSYYLYTMVQKRFGKGIWTHSSHVGISEYRGVAVVHSQGFFYRKSAILVDMPSDFWEWESEYMGYLKSIWGSNLVSVSWR